MSGSNTSIYSQSSTAASSSTATSSPTTSVPKEVATTISGFDYIDFSNNLMTSLVMGTLLKMGFLNI